MKRALVRLLAFGALTSGCQGDADFSDAMPPVETLKAESYQTEIRKIDWLVFKEEPFDEKRREALSAEIEGLAGRMKASSDSKFIALEVLELRRLAKIAERLPDRLPDPRFSDQWMRIRNNVFDDRAWFARSAGDLLKIPPAGPPPERPVQTYPTEKRPEAPAGLAGPWRVLELRGNGEPRSDPVQKDAVWTFEGERLTIAGPAGTLRFAYQSVMDSRGSALFLQSESDDSKRGWMAYQISDGRLRVAFYDGLGPRPHGFEADPDGEPMLVTILLAR